MAQKTKTAETEVKVVDFIHSYVDNEQKKQDSFQLIELMKKWSGFEPKMWGPTIIGFGSYHYKYASGHEGDSLIIGFSPRKAEFSLYAVAPGHENNELIENLGKIKMGKACIYFKKLADINIDVLEKLCLATIKHINEHHECGCHE
ncbi:MAG TPA: DUF1801 domain-containing protein [Saprospiraceae bacterium]|nr:DUF1801 domain-containing protein [Saprospiraceae bacterium]